jgi:hypothetical protein
MGGVDIKLEELGLGGGLMIIVDPRRITSSLKRKEKNGIK